MIVLRSLGCNRLPESSSINKNTGSWVSKWQAGESLSEAGLRKNDLISETEEAMYLKVFTVRRRNKNTRNIKLIVGSFSVKIASENVRLNEGGSLKVL